MTDPISAGLGAFESGLPVAAVYMFAAGVLTSLGPCVAPRYIAVAALSTEGRQGAHSRLAFVAGLIGAYVAIGFTAGALPQLVAKSPAIDAILAVGLVASGAHAILRAAPVRPHSCGASDGQRACTSRGGPFLLGAAGALIVSPCCTPVVTAVISTSAMLGRPAAGAAMLGIFAVGHALPLLAAGSASSILTRAFSRTRASQAPGIIAGTLLIALGCYYGTIA